MNLHKLVLSYRRFYSPLKSLFFAKSEIHIYRTFFCKTFAYHIYLTFKQKGLMKIPKFAIKKYQNNKRYYHNIDELNAENEDKGQWLLLDKESYEALVNHAKLCDISVRTAMRDNLYASFNPEYDGDYKRKDGLKAPYDPTLSDEDIAASLKRMKDNPYVCIYCAY
jgi:hypothetical protein